MRRASKKSVIAGVLAFSMILTGTGYAYWTDTLNVTTKATTGDLDVTFVDFSLYAQYTNGESKGWSIVDGIGTDASVNSEYFMRGDKDHDSIAAAEQLKAYEDRREGYHSVSFDQAGLKNPSDLTKDQQVSSAYPEGTNHSDKIEISLNNLYPGYAQTYRTDIINIGNIAAKLSDVKFTVTGDLTSDVDEMLGVALLLEHEVGGNDTTDTFALCKQLGVKAEDIFTVGGVDFLRLSALTTQVIDKVAEVLEANTLLCKPNDHRMDLFLAVAMDPDEEGQYTTGSASEPNENGKDYESQNRWANLSVDLVWDQFNAGTEKNVTEANILEKQNVPGGKAN